MSPYMVKYSALPASEDLASQRDSKSNFPHDVENEDQVGRKSSALLAISTRIRLCKGLAVLMVFGIITSTTITIKSFSSNFNQRHHSGEMRHCGNTTAEAEALGMQIRSSDLLLDSFSVF